jgi:hypothetical protein
VAEKKLKWEGAVRSVQPRIRLLRSFDQRSHTYLGYVLRISGILAGESAEYLVAIGPAAQQKHHFRVGDEVQGESEPVADPRLETASLYKTSGLKVLRRGPLPTAPPPPWLDTAPSLETYRERGHRRLSAATYGRVCTACIWGCKMPVEIIIDHWNQSQRRYRFETFCYGPKSCKFYKAGPTRKVPGRRGMTWEEEDWVDEEETAHRD